MQVVPVAPACEGDTYSDNQRLLALQAPSGLGLASQLQVMDQVPPTAPSTVIDDNYSDVAPLHHHDEDGDSDGDDVSEVEEFDSDDEPAGAASASASASASPSGSVVMSPVQSGSIDEDMVESPDGARRPRRSVGSLKHSPLFVGAQAKAGAPGGASALQGQLEALQDIAMGELAWW